ncbi:hypothetical protein TVAG_340420 [Trichomonas vaginalis G3]|uniref:Uncharacterized protein n=1 Tax=Trichomonas vaginalis (strain ATCC PRA-98 / G3) TaxID=412133 RepID=A2EKF6_TRIV3|nr:beta-tubulin binding [Trichomonas vaginalis G3]EAY06864.1 hypothetical protein TVAG_340420 [Trichomonas vaginalis G3]KAI5489192.1 beta-tubulin binding [Trichomonas vaginalis G3]|eukprot:XP_001319087.1 hypothetical protein [Trichomonas vaginalis G3]
MQQSYQRLPSANKTGMRPPSSKSKISGDVPFPSKTISANRPQTIAQGLPSAHTQKGQRQVADSKYYIGILRQRLNDIVQEIKRLEAENEERKRGQAIQVSLQQEVQDLRTQINAQEAELADYNVLADRLSSKVSYDEMQASLKDTQASNAQLEKEADRLYRERKDLEAIVTDQEKQVQEMMRGSGAPELQKMAAELEQLESECQKLRGTTGNLAGKSREELLQIVKDTTSKIGDIDKQIQDEQKSLQYVQQQIKNLEAREADQNTERGKKYLTLLNREKDMNNFIKNYPQNLENAQQELANAQKRVVDILSETSRDIETIDKLPTLENYQQLQQDLSYKEQQTKAAQATATQLQLEVEQRRRELEDLQNVDQKIKQEEESLQKQMDSMTREMPSFNNVDAIREEGEIRKKQKMELRDSLKLQLKNIKKATNLAATQYNDNRASLRTNETHTKLHQLEKDLQQKALENAAIIEYIEEDRRKTNYAMVKRQALAIVNEINQSL